MGNPFGGGGPKNITQTQNRTVPPWITGPAQDLLGQYIGLVNNSPFGYTKFSPFQAPQVAPFTPAQIESQQQMLDLGPVFSSGLMGVLGGLTGLAGREANINWQPGPLNFIQPGGGGYGTGGGGYGAGYPGGFGGTGGGGDPSPPRVPPVSGGPPTVPNPYLDQYYKAAADQLTKQYKYATAPSQMSQAIQAGALGGSSDLQQRLQNEFGLGQNLSNLGAAIYEPAYESQQRLLEQAREANLQQSLGLGQLDLQKLLGMRGLDIQQLLGQGQLGIAAQQIAEQAQAANLQAQLQQQQLGLAGQQLGLQGMGMAGNLLQSLPNLLQALYYPSQVMGSVGAQQQGQQQNILNALTAGTNMAYQYPYGVLGGLGNLIGMLGDIFGGVTQTSRNPLR